MRCPHLLPGRSLLLCLPALLLPGGPVRAQQAPAPRPTFAQALAALEAPKQDLFLAVGADKVELPPGIPPPDPTDRPGAVGETYGRLARDFGGVTALAPPTMVVLNTHPGVPDPYDGMPPADTLKLLLAGLNPLQWAALTSENGLELSDLDESQRSLFEEVLPSGDGTAFPQSNEAPPGIAPTAPIPLTAQDLRRGARLHLGRQTVIYFQTLDNPNGFSGNDSGSFPNGTTRYIIAPARPRPAQATTGGALLRQRVSNAPKESDLDYEAFALKQSIRVDGIATVGDLIARVGQAAGLELYADRRYEGRTVTLVGRRTARAVDLLRAVAFCVTGTFRKVGPVYVLTDDREGTATRRQRLARFVQAAEMARAAALVAAGDSLLTARGGMDALPQRDGLGISDAQRGLPPPGSGVGSMVRVTLDQLTPAQRERAASEVDRANEAADRFRSLGGTMGGTPRPPQTLTGPFLLAVAPLLYLQSPAVPGPITLGVPLDLLYRPSVALQRERMRQRKDRSPAKPPAPPPALAALLAPFPRRAALAAPKTAAELDRVLSGMKALGLNQLWLEVFSGGHSCLDASPSLLAEALAETKGTGIAVLPALDLLRWGADAPAEALDRTALGETSAEQQAWRRRYAGIVQDPAALVQDVETAAPPADVWACPAAPAVEQALLAQVRRLAATPGVTTLALCGTDPPGYSHAFRFDSASLGYVPGLRLALLRRDHADPLDLVDPLDLDTGPVLPSGADVSLPDFGDGDAAKIGDAAKDWDDLRGASIGDLLRHLLTDAQQTGGRQVRFLVPRRGGFGTGGWYGLWEDPQAPLPALRPAGAAGPLTPPSETDLAPLARSQSRINLYAIPSWAASDASAAAAALRALKPGWGGVVLEVNADQLAALARSVKP